MKIISSNKIITNLIVPNFWDQSLTVHCHGRITLLDWHQK